MDFGGINEPQKIKKIKKKPDQRPKTQLGLNLQTKYLSPYEEI